MPINNPTIAYFLSTLNSKTEYSSYSNEEKFTLLWQLLNLADYKTVKYSSIQDHENEKYNDAGFYDQYNDSLVFINEYSAKLNKEYSALTLSIFANNESGITFSDFNNFMGYAIQNLFTGDANDNIDATNSNSAVLVDSAGGDDNLTGSQYGDVLYGSSGNDILKGLAGDDTLIGGEGSDTFQGGNGNDTLIIDEEDLKKNIDGGFGTDSLFFNFKNAVDITTDYNGIEKYYTTDFDDKVLVSQYAYTNFLSTGNGNDKITSYSAVQIDSGAGNDTIFSYAFRYDLVSIDAGEGDDDITIGELQNNFSQGYYFNSNSQKINGGAGNDTLHFTSSYDVVFYLTTSKIENVFSGSGNDVLSASNSDVDVTIDGGAGNDYIFGGNANNTLSGGDGDDYIIFNGKGTVNGGKGYDTVILNTSEYVYFNLSQASAIEKYVGGSGMDIVIAADNMTKLYIDTGDGNDGVEGGDNDDIINGGNGSDNLYAKMGNDTVNGGAGDDSLRGAKGDDLLHGDDGNDYLSGGKDNDTIYGDNGDDLIMGDLGKDKLYGGSGNDVFKFNLLEDSKINNSDLIMDFTKGEDLIDLSGLGFKQINNSATDSSSLIYHYDVKSGNTIIESQDHQFQINVVGNIDFNNSDFVF